MRTLWLVGILAAAVAVQAAPAAQGGGAQADATALGTVRLTQGVMANGQPLAAGTYQVRVTAEEARPPAAGQAPSSERWVEFVQGGEVKGREVASIISDGDIGQVAKGPRPQPGSSRIELLKGGDYLRVWISRGGNHYLIHLPPA